MNYFTLNNIKDLFQVFADNHYQIKRSGFGIVPDVEEMISEEQTFPVLYANLIDVQYPSDNLKTYNFNILVFDILKNDKSNEQDVWSDCIQIGEDFIRFLNHNSSDYYQVIGQPRIETFTERFSDFVAGCNLNLFIQVDSNLQNDCGIPMDDVQFSVPSFIATPKNQPSSFSCDDLLGCSTFTDVLNQSQTNYDNIVILSGNQSTFNLSLANYLPLSGGTVTGDTVLRIESETSISNSIFSSTGNSLTYVADSGDDNLDFYLQGYNLFGYGINGTAIGKVNEATGDSILLAIGDLTAGGLSNYSLFANAESDSDSKSSSLAIVKELVYLRSGSGANETNLIITEDGIYANFKGEGYKLPNTSGQTGQAILNDGFGHAYWGDLTNGSLVLAYTDATADFAPAYRHC
jgi:hypothetical protein